MEEGEVIQWKLQSWKISATVREEREQKEYLYLFSFCPPISCLCLPLIKPNQSLGKGRLAMQSMENLLDQTAGQRRIDNGMGQERGVVPDSNPYTSEDFRAFCAQPLPPQCSECSRTQDMFQSSHFFKKQEKRKNPGNTCTCVLFVVAFNLLCQSFFS